MILRRITSAFRRQDWFMVGIETLIVVLGVFLGLQVNNWNEARKDRAEERQLLTRLDDEARALLETQTSEYAKQEPRVEAMTAIHPLLFDQTPGRALTSLECRFIAISHWLPAPTDELPILEEAIATGRFDLISNEEVKESLRNFAVVRNRSRRQYDEAINELFRLPNRHPDAVWAVRKPIDDGDGRAPWVQDAGNGYKWWDECNLDNMRNDKAFLSDYYDNISRLDGYLERYGETIAALDSLEKALASELGAPHASENGKGAP